MPPGIMWAHETADRMVASLHSFKERGAAGYAQVDSKPYHSSRQMRKQGCGIHTGASASERASAPAVVAVQVQTPRTGGYQHYPKVVTHEECQQARIRDESSTS